MEEIRQKPVDGGRIYHYVRFFTTSQVVSRISEPSTVPIMYGWFGVWMSSMMVDFFLTVGPRWFWSLVVGIYGCYLNLDTFGSDIAVVKSEFVSHKPMQQVSQSLTGTGWVRKRSAKSRVRPDFFGGLHGWSGWSFVDSLKVEAWPWCFQKGLTTRLCHGFKVRRRHKRVLPGSKTSGSEILMWLWLVR